MKALLLLLLVAAATAVLVQGQGTPDTPPHLLFTPQRYHVGATESFSFVSYSQLPLVAVVTVSYETCVCDSRGVRRCSGNNVFSRDRARSQRGSPAVLNVEMPRLDQLQGRNYYIEVTSHNGSVTYLFRQRISFSFNSFGFLLVKTDKPIYKPSQDVRFCLAYVDKALKPHSGRATVEVTIRDAAFRQIKKWDAVRMTAGGFTCLEFPLADEPNLGTWRIDANIKIPGDDGRCRVFYSLPRASCNFKVEEFVIPRFQVTLDGPRHILREDVDITGTVTAKYTFGDSVQGMVRVNATLISSRRSERLLFYDRLTRLNQNGQFRFRIRSDLYQDRVRFRYDPFCVSSRVLIVAEVVEAGRRTNQSTTLTIPMVSNPVSVKFADENPNLFKAGLNYTMRAQASYADGSPALGASVRVTATINNGVSTIFDNTVSASDGDGSIATSLFVPSNANCLKITIVPEGSVPSCEEQRICFSPSPAYSPTGSFLQLDYDPTFPLPITVGDRARFMATSTVPFITLHLLVISQGSIQHHTHRFDRDGTTSARVFFQSTHAMVPRVKVLGVFAREDGELVADLVELPVNCEFENEVSVKFNSSTASPGDPIQVSLQASPRSIVLLSALDQGLTLLAEACESIESDSICRLLRSLTTGSLVGGSTCALDNPDSCCPSACSEPTLYGVSSFFNAAGISLRSNMFQPNPPFIPGPTPPFYFRPFPDYYGGAEYDRFPGTPGQPGAPTTPPPPAPEDDGGDDGPRVRRFFPESWLWTLRNTNDDGEATLSETVPDTITTWVAEAVALSGETGLGISPRASLTVSKPFFVSLELPFSIIFGEVVTITPLVFFFDKRRKSTTVTIAITVDDDLDLLETTGLDENSQLVVESGGSTPFTMKLRPRSIGELLVAVTAVGDEREVDIVQKPLLVRPGCERLEMTENVFAEGSDVFCFNFSLPTCVIPGSAKAVISVTGDVMSPPNLDRLLVLPTGCGEQNLVKIATNLVVGMYLEATEQLSDFITVKIRNNIELGYQRQLTYLQSSGCFSVWARGDCSLWLTAAVVNTFSSITSFFRDLDETVEVVDRAVVDGARNYIISRQNKDGSLPIIGRVHNYGLLNREDLVAHTAFGLLALKEYEETYEISSIATSRAEQYIVNRTTQRPLLCNYGQAVGTYAVFKNSEEPPVAANRMLRELKRRITRSRAYPGTCVVCNDCPGQESEREEGMDCQGRPRYEGSSACVETTAYTLLALLEAEETEDTVCLAQWLVRIRSGSGGFWTSTDTVVAMQALSRFAELTFTTELDKEVTIAVPGLGEDPISRSINSKNRFERFDVEIPSVPSTDNCVSWDGNGTAIIQGTVEYYGCNCCDETRAFSLVLATVKEVTSFGTTVELTVRMRYLSGDVSNMAIVDVEIPSGYVFGGWRFEDIFGRNADVERVEQRGANVIFYFNEIPQKHHTTIIVDFAESFAVEDPQQLPVVLYDYYDPGQTVTKYYLPVTSSPLPPITTEPPPTFPEPE